jgi:phospholipase D1/2
VATIFTHHQKTVLVDSEAVGSRRKITAFLGGLDLCDGRYDTPEHHLFRTLGTVHKDDYRNRTFTVNLYLTVWFVLIKIIPSVCVD